MRAFLIILQTAKNCFERWKIKSIIIQEVYQFLNTVVAHSLGKSDYDSYNGIQKLGPFLNGNI